MTKQIQNSKFKIIKAEVLRYLHVWYRLTTSSFKTSLMSRIGAGVFILGKVIRFVFILFFLIVLIGKTNVLAEYSLNETLIFFMTYNVIDTITQLLFREVYRFRPLIVSGDFDLVLTRPISPLFRVLLGGADPLDIIMLVPYLGFLTYLIIRLPELTIHGVVLFLFLMINGFIIATAFHIFVLALGILTTEIDHTIMIYRDVTSMTRFPIDIYKEPLRSFVTFVIPVGIMVSFPPKALFGLLSIKFIIIAVLFGGGSLVSSLYMWKHALRKYSSASS